ncbi:hypothetical protein CcaverHIS002_0203790 [Cutaneotrichosporon cavernicola]|uniref:Uncharacterized protein n=1 Tax=Cutaneotrichosporon cavernicola TaxID=279322 RepID=A0AA48KY51_9TREE|nr:uncharacterized protein CcaverHIS019_0203760 [Cutaneotrichosporon cavernicola]BEI81219.1 hypothetical protein CcaverHIS002_0203790 [Cutaneotrichosporon cavernicola]BEI89014.1 hypothetical protein CcaverHIS019_0203760 [Cutaneotrichosporon cavernicola]BEI96790.1 hypothetical protein CcaverHIS631_0203790 [Cutaneotrichosporon cavernicola]BEJ04562.1 hypothetical protein CcaverHIS641_0203790 [Cutaneotrichosporon cavernicola]
MAPTSSQVLGTSPLSNHFAALSPEMIHASLEDPEMNAILGLAPPRAGIASSASTRTTSEPPSKTKGPLKVYTCTELLRLSGRARSPKLPPFESWFGTPAPAGARVDDPAIASINASGGRRAGGAGSFGEGFGFGGGIGIGGRGLGRGGTRNVGLRRQQQQDNPNIDPAIVEQGRGNFGGPMGKFSMRPSGERGMRLGGEEVRQHRDGDKGDRDRRRRDDGDWRRGDRQQQPPLHHNRNGEGSRRGPPGFSGPRYDDDSIEPAWMSDDVPAIEDPAIASSSAGETAVDGLVQFVPGQDMIAAHKRAMKARAAGGAGQDNWRASDKNLVSFFGGQEAAAAPPPTPPKPKEVDHRSYFKKRNVIDDDDDESDDKNEPSSQAFQSRFQRFFTQETVASTVQPVPQMAHRAPSPQAPMPPPQMRPSPIVRGPSEPQKPLPSPGPQNAEDHLAKLMGVLSTRSISPAQPRPASAEMAQQRMPPNLGHLPPFPGDQYPPPPPGLHYDYGHSPTEAPSDYNRPTAPNDYNNLSHHQTSRRDMSPERPDMPPHMMPPPQHRGSHYSSPPPGADPRGYPFPGQRGPPPPPGPGYPRSPMGELPANGPPPFYDRMGGPPPGVDLLQMLQRGPLPPPPMGMLPPHPSMYGPPPPGGPGGHGPSPDDLLRNLQGGGPNGPPPGLPQYSRPPMGPGGPGYGPLPMQGFLPPHAPQFYQGGGAPPGPPPGMSMGPGGPRPPGMMPYPGAPNQDMLAALLGPRTNGH